MKGAPSLCVSQWVLKGASRGSKKVREGSSRAELEAQLLSNCEMHLSQKGASHSGARLTRDRQRDVGRKDS